MFIEKDVMELFMRKCIDIAKDASRTGNYPHGSLITRGNEIIASASNKLISGYDPTAHPEIVTIREAAQKLQTRYLLDTILYSTLEPCPMCTSAAIWAKMKGIVFGSSQQDASIWAKKYKDPLYTWRQIAISCTDVARAGEPKIFVVGSILHEECNELFKLAR